MKKGLLPILVSLFLLVLLSACNSSSKTTTDEATDPVEDDAEPTTEETTEGTSDLTEPVEIEFWHAMSGGHEEALTAIVDAFNEEYELITVKPVNQGSYDDLQQKIMAGARANTLPDVAQSVTDIIPQYIDNDFITPLNTFVEDPEIGLSDDELADIIDIFRASSSWDGEMYSVPFSKSTRILYYNGTMFEENGVEVPETWQDIVTISEQLTGDGVIGMGFENQYESEFLALLKQLGGVYIDEASNEAQLSSEAGVQAFTFIKDMIDNGIARLAGEDQYMSNPFGRGDVAMYIGSSAGIPHVGGAMEEGIEWSTTTFPTFEGAAATLFAGNDVVMFNQGEEAEQVASWEFMKYLISPEVTSEWAMASGYLPVRYSAEELPEYASFLEENPAHAAGPNQFDAGFSNARVTASSAVRNIVLEEFENIMLDRKSIEDGLQDAEDRANEELAK